MVEMQKLFNDHFDCETVNKFYTSQICCDCKTRLHRCMNKDRDEESGFRKEIRGVRFCGGCDARISFKSRDGNAARNILVKGKYFLENGENDPDYAKQDGKMTDKLVKFYPTDPNRPKMQMKTREGPRRRHAR